MVWYYSKVLKRPLALDIQARMLQGPSKGNLPRSMPTTPNLPT